MRKAVVTLTLLVLALSFNACKSSPDLSGKWLSDSDKLFVELKLKEGSDNIYIVDIYYIIKGKKWNEQKRIGKFEDDVIHMKRGSISYINDNLLTYSNRELHRIN